MRILILCSLLIGFSNLFGQINKLETAKDCMSTFKYAEAIDHLQVLHADNKLEHICLLGDAYYKIRDFQHAQYYYELSLSQNTRLRDDQKLRYVNTLIMNKRIDEAKDYLADYKTNDLPNIHLDSLQKWLAEEADFKIDLIEINPTTSEYASFLHKDKIWISSEGNEDKELYAWTGRPFIRLYEATYSQEGDIGTVHPLELIENTKGHLANLAWDPIAKEYFYTTNKTEKKRLKPNEANQVQMEIRTSSNENTDSIGYFEYNGNYSTTHPFISPDGQHLFFTSDMPGGFGGTDVYVCYRLVKGWSAPQNLGADINTDRDEAFPTCDSLNNLYFSSEGLLGLGGLDIFKATFDGDNWGTVRNLKSPINSTKDDFLLLPIGLDEEKGFLSSNRFSSNGSDDILYFENISTKVDEVETEDGEDGMDTVTVAKQYVQFVIIDEETGNPLINTMVTVKDPTTGWTFNTTSDKDGVVRFEGDPNKPYEVTIEKEGYFRYTNDDMNTGKQETVSLFKEKVDEAIELQRIYYDFNSAELRVESTIQLNKVIKLLLDNPSMEIEIMAHTDCRASASYNLGLSMARASEAAKYIIRSGIKPQRVKSKGYGESQPRNQCVDGVPCSEALHQQNRRTEFKVLRYDKRQRSINTN